VRAALSFLTVLPLGRGHAVPGRAALLAFPLAGLTVGGAWALTAWAGTQAWSPLAAAALVIAVDLVLTGALHIDAVADVADGLASRRPPQEAVRIMREPAVGAVGAAAAAAALLLRLAWVAVLASAGLWLVLAAVPVCGRAAMVTVLAAGRRGEGPSLAAAVAGAATPAVALGAGAGAAGLAALAGAAAGGPALGGLAVAGLAAGLALALAGARAWDARFGPVTGDLAGAAGLAAELAALAVLAAAPALGLPAN
jgi:adenosylcobinamide-GDP ribazoletransferase